MALIRLTRRFTFEAAHALAYYDGLCRHIHGHSYKLEITVLGEPRQESGHPKDGMVLDFGELKSLVQTHVLAPLDHALVLRQDSPASLLQALQEQKLLLLPYQPTCENLLLYVKDQLLPQLPADIPLYSIRLWETENAFAEWFAADNP